MAIELYPNQCSVNDLAFYGPEPEELASLTASDVIDPARPGDTPLSSVTLLKDPPPSILVRTGSFGGKLIADLGIGLGGYAGGMASGGWAAAASCGLAGLWFPPVLAACPWVAIAGASVGAGAGGVASNVISQRLVHDEPQTDWTMALTSGAVNMIPAGAIALTGAKEAGKIAFTSVAGQRVAATAQWIAASNTLGWQPFIQRGIVNGGLGLFMRSAVTLFDNKPGFDAGYIFNPVSIGIDVLGPEVIVRGLKWVSSYYAQKKFFLQPGPKPEITVAPGTTVGATSSSFPLLTNLKKGVRLRIIYGITHGGSNAEWQHVKEIIAEAYRKRARSVGLEITPNFLENNDFFPNIFKKAAEYAKELGMEVIPIDSNEVGDMRRLHDLMLSFVSSEGGIRRETVEKIKAELVANLEVMKSWISRSAGYLAPEIYIRKNHLVAMIDGIEQAQTILEANGYDLNSVVMGLQEWNLTRFEDGVRETLVARRPDIVFIGGGHLKGLSGVEGYKCIDAGLPGLARLPNFERYPRTLQFFTDYSRKHLLNRTVEMYAQMQKVIGDIFPNRAGDLPLLEKILTIEPDFPYIVSRTFRLMDPEGLQYLQMSEAEATARIRDAVTKASE